MTALSNDSNDSSAEYDDPEFLSLMANLDLSREVAPPLPPHPTPPPPASGRARPRPASVHAGPSPPRTPARAWPPIAPVHAGPSHPRTPARARPPPPPRTPSPPAYVQVAPRTLPAVSRRTYTQTRPTIYAFENLTTSGHTPDWSTAGSATQSVPGGRVHVIQTASPKKKRRSKKVAYVIFCGIEIGIFFTWIETERLVRGVPNCIFRGYATVAEAVAAFDYAVERQWTRTVGTVIEAPIPELPQPTAHLPHHRNPLNGSEDLDDTWFVVYRGITPGVYRSHLECQLNTLGVRGALHESIVGQEAAMSKYMSSTRLGQVRLVFPPYPESE